MNAVDIINKKRKAETLSHDEIDFMVMGYTEGRIADYQMSALLMAICINGMTKEETVHLTNIMRDSGDVVDLSGIQGTKVDKHSTGGVGDKTTLIVGPLAAACGVPIAKMSGRGLGFTGGTIDKLEAISGFQTSMEEEDFIESVNRVGISVIGQTGHIAPADKKLYALRDVTGTTESISLITSSIMSKKLAAGSDAIILDVKCGNGAFMKTLDEARELADWMVDIGRMSGKKMTAIISDMNQPLGNAVGNSLEVREAIEVLRGNGPEDITELSLTLAGAMIAAGTAEKNSQNSCKGEEAQNFLNECREKAKRALDNGEGLKKLREMIANQGGCPDITEDLQLLPEARTCVDVIAREAGFVTELDAMTIGLASQHSGAGREKKEDGIDMSAGILLHKKIGDSVESGDVLCSVYGNDEDKVRRAADEAEKAYRICSNIDNIEPRELIKAIII